jgi:hypothetical protein
MRRKRLKKLLIKTILKIPGHLPLDRVDVWFQNKAGFGQQNTTTRIWAEKGTRPSVIQQQQFTYAYLFGAVCVTNVNIEAIVAPLSNMEVIKSHLALISEATEADRHAVVIMDDANWHQEYLDQDLPNLSIIHIPPYSTELNPIEQVWSWLRQNEIANPSFADYEEIVDKCSIVWNNFVANTEQVLSLRRRH